MSEEVTQITTFPTNSPQVITDWTYKRFYLGHTFNTLIGGLDLWLGLQAIVMNVLVMCFYVKSYKKIVPFMYILIACCDCLTGCAAVLMSVIFFLLNTAPHTALSLLAPAYSIFSVTFKVSVFLNLSISIVRTINIYLPFHRMRILEIAIATGVYTAGWVAFLSWELSEWNWYSLDYSQLEISVYSPGQYHQLAVNTDGRTNSYSKECRRVMLFIGLPYLLPSLFVVFCMLLQLKTILKRRPDKTSNTETQRKITITILMLTAVFFVCNTVYVIYPISYCTRKRSMIGFAKTTDEYRKDFMIRHVTGVVCPFLNAAVNPVILIARGEALSKFLKRKLLNFSGSITSVSSRKTTSYSTSIRNPSFKPRPASMMSISEVPLTTLCTPVGTPTMGTRTMGTSTMGTSTMGTSTMGPPVMETPASEPQASNIDDTEV